MKAFIYKQNDGRDTLGTWSGSRGGWITVSYANLDKLLRLSFKDKPDGEYHVEAFYNWENRYKKADVDEIVTIKDGKVISRKPYQE